MEYYYYHNVCIRIDHWQFRTSFAQILDASIRCSLHLRWKNIFRLQTDGKCKSLVLYTTFEVSKLRLLRWLAVFISPRAYGFVIGLIVSLSIISFSEHVQRTWQACAPVRVCLPLEATSEMGKPPMRVFTLRILELTDKHVFLFYLF